MALTEPNGGPDSSGEQAHDRSPRVPASQLETPRARLLPGGDVSVINMSDTGLLVEGKTRPAIGTTVTIRIQGTRGKLEGRIVRSRISTIHRDGTLSYESAIEFETPTSVQDLVSSRAVAAVGTNDQDPDVYVIDGDNDW